MNDFLIKRSEPVSLYSNMLTFRDSNICFNLDGHVFKTMTYYDFNVTHSIPQDQKLNYEFGREMNYDIKRIGQKSNRDKSLGKLLKSPAIKASGISTIILPEKSDKGCDSLKILLQEIDTGNNSDIIDEEIVAIADKLFEYKRISKK